MPATINRRQALLGLATTAGWALTGCASPPRDVSAALPQPAPGVVQALAPTGRLRACINLGNPILARRAAGGEAGVAGVSVDLAEALAQRLGVPLALDVVESAGLSVERVKGGLCDIGFFAVDPLRSDGIRFSAPYLQIEGAYLVRAASPITANEQVDRPGTRVVVGRASAYDLYLGRALQAAQLERAPTSPRVVDTFLALGADVAAGVRQQLEADARRLPGLRLLPGRFMVIEQAMGLPAGRGEAAQGLLRAFVEQAKASGFVAAALQRHGIAGATVAAAAA